MVRSGEMIDGIITAAAGFATAAIGAAAGAGLLAVARLATALVLIALEGPRLPLLRLIDARRWSPGFQHDADLDRDDDRAVLPDATASPDDDQRPTESRSPVNLTGAAI